MESLEAKLDAFSRRLKPYMPLIGRVLLVLTFVEDALRMIFDWPMQVKFLRRNGLVAGLAELFLVFNIVVQLTCSALAILRIRTIPAVVGLTVVMFLQVIAYRLYGSFEKLVVFLSLIGGLLILVSESKQSQQKRESDQSPFGDLLATAGKHTTHLLLFGRILLICLYFNLAFDFRSTMSWTRIILAVVGLVPCVLVVVGFKAKTSAGVLLLILVAITLVTKNWWDLTKERQRDFLRYEFFQLLSVAGGFLLLALTGPGNLSVDQRTKAE